MTPDNLADWIIQWLIPMTQKERLAIMNEITERFCPKCGRENSETLNGERRRCPCS